MIPSHYNTPFGHAYEVTDDDFTRVFFLSPLPVPENASCVNLTENGEESDERPTVKFAVKAWEANPQEAFTIPEFTPEKCPHKDGHVPCDACEGTGRCDGCHKCEEHECGACDGYRSVNCPCFFDFAMVETMRLGGQSFHEAHIAWALSKVGESASAFIWNPSVVMLVIVGAKGRAIVPAIF